MRVIRKTSRDFVTKHWKNGLGVTREIHIHPEGANFETDNFLWRLSSADVTAGGPFSFFPGYDRSLFLLSGEGLDLELRGVKVSLAAPFSSIRFKGEDEVMCSLPGGPCTDFNIFCSRNAVSCEYRKIPVTALQKRLFLLGDWTVLFCLRGSLTAEWEGEWADLGGMDLLVLEGYPADFSLTCRGAPDGEILLVTLTARD